MTGDGTIPRISIVLPILDTTQGLPEAVRSYAKYLNGLGATFEMLLVASPACRRSCEDAALAADPVRVVEVGSPQWGRFVRAGLAQCSGDVLCFTNWQRTSGAALAEMLSYALRNRELVLRANRRTRDTVRQRLGSLLFNLECRAALGTGAWDVNGTPKIFSRTRVKLLELTRDDDLIDAEFALICEREGYPVAEIPIEASPEAGHVAKPDYVSALKMYLGVLGLRRQLSR